LAWGDCGGYKTMIRKPTKKERYTVIGIVVAGFLIFLICLSFNVYFGRLDNLRTKDLALSLVDRNRQQINIFKSIKGMIDKINYKKLNVRFSQVSLEKFKIGNFMEGINLKLQKSLNNAKFLQEHFFYANKNATYLRILLISLSVVISIFLYVVFYRTRKLFMNLILTAVMVVLMIVSLNSLAVLFNNFSINVEICDEAIKIFNKSYGDIRYRVGFHFDEFLTCLDFETKQNLKSQMMANLIAVNSVLIIFRNFFNVEDQTVIAKGYFDSAMSVEENKIEILEHLEEVQSRGDTATYTLMKNYLETVQMINLLNQKIDSLLSCENLKHWANEINKRMCKEGLNYQFYAGVAFFGIIIAMFIITLGFFASENVVRGIYNEEIKYVKTNKQRYDWN
jgi:hypothetical protein